MGLFDGLFGGGSNPAKEAAKLAKDALKYYKDIDVPELEEYVLQHPELVGLLEEMGPSALEQIKTDPNLRAVALENLEALRQESQEGMTAADRLQMEEMLGGVAAQEKAQRAAIEQEMARQGMGDSGAALQAKLLGSQGATNAARRQAMQMIAQSGDRRRQARRESSALAGQMEGQDFSRQAQVAQAEDAINKYNTQVQAQNLAARQNIENQRANIASVQAGLANQLAQQNFQNQMSLASGKAGVQGNAAQMVGAQPAQPTGFQNLLQTGATIASIGGTGGFGFWGKDKTKAEDGGIIPQSSGGVPVDQKALIAHQKQEAKFKRDYMKKIHSELLGEEKKFHAENGGLAQTRYEDPKYPVGTKTTSDFSGLPSINDLSSSMLGGVPIPNNYVEVPQEVQAPAMKAAVGPKVDPKLAELRNAQGEHDRVLKAEKDKEGTKKTKRVLKGISKLNELLGFQEQERELPELQEVNPEVKNILPEYKPMDFGNPFAQAAEDGAVMDPVADIIGKAMARKQMAEGGSEEAKMMDMIRSMEEVPAMQDGGTYQAQDGSLLFTSDGSGDIVEGDSYERDRVDARLNSGEMVLNAAQQQRLMDMLRGEISLDELGDDDIVEGVPREYQEDIINGDDDGDIQAKGMNRLLDMLGRK